MPLILLLFQLVTHPCDLPQQSDITVKAGARFTFSWCHDNKDATGKMISITAWRMQRNTDIPVMITPVMTPTANSAGFRGYSLSKFEPSRGYVTYGISALSGTLESVRVKVTITVQ